ncbi:MAG: hypothetical protein A3F35_02630 [Candidatus Woykebacteria bacterium RIFCSPHIGHO2_12_FULL_45_10]|uniref:STAS/SEC14 domain-containing protein n=1 Tax=Candidatus Woykebacteria bacterium RIFCSPHIGHO2_12_FULL_45_10 TaxID=1802603 RepID=A0A1G1WQ47_9BACT|nr:MAG: hypothetical protein A3F35_02630 [Candidatus Woykebacteria bacterium RIFCSPHIGHO2_12_FULL_45_10]
MKSDSELVGSFKVGLDEDGILILTFLHEEKDPEDNTRQSELVLGELSKVFSGEAGKQFNLLVDLTPVESANYVSDKSRELYLKAKMQDHLSKVAVVSSSILLRVFVLFVAQATGKGDSVKWFETKDEALEWLKS